MRLAAGRLRVSVGFSFSASRKSRDEILHDRARAYAERSLNSCFKRTVIRPASWWRTDIEPRVYERWVGPDGMVNSRTATLLAERRAVLDVLDGRNGWWSGQRGVAVPRWRWLKRRRLEAALCHGHRIEKWW